MEIKELLNGYLDKLKVYPDQTLFPDDWSLLKKKRCIWCGNKLKLPLKGDKAFCNGKKHKRIFVISKSKL